MEMKQEILQEADIQMMLMIDSYSAERKEQRVNLVEQCGINLGRLALYKKGLVSLTADESELMTQAQVV